MENIRYVVIGKRKEELLHPTGSYIREEFGDAVQEIRHIIGNTSEHIYHFGEKLGNTTIIITEYSSVYGIFVDIIGEEDGCKKTKSKLEKKFTIRLNKF